MRKFAFRLHRALRFAWLKENQKRTQVANALQRIRFLEKYETQLNSRISVALGTSYSALNTLAGDAHGQAILPAVDERRKIVSLIAEENAALLDRQKELIRLSQRRRSLESLREKKAREFRIENSRREQKIIDDTVSLSKAQKNFAEESEEE